MFVLCDCVTKWSFCRVESIIFVLSISVFREKSILVAAVTISFFENNGLVFGLWYLNLGSSGGQALGQ